MYNENEYLNTFLCAIYRITNPINLRLDKLHKTQVTGNILLIRAKKIKSNDLYNV